MSQQPVLIYWFRTDLRLHDAVALARALQLADRLGASLLPVVVDGSSLAGTTGWGFERVGWHRRRWRADALRALARRLWQKGSGLMHLASVEELLGLARSVSACGLVCEDIAAPEEQAEVAWLRAQGIVVEAVWQSSLLHPDDLPWPTSDVPTVFTAFRQGVERAGCRPRAPLDEPETWPAWPAGLPKPPPDGRGSTDVAPSQPSLGLRETLLPRHELPGSEGAALAHLRHYLSTDRPGHYKATRNALSDWASSSKWSLWLAQGTLSPRTVYAALQLHEAEQGANDGTYWLWFELLWRDHFRFMHRRFGVSLFRAQGLSSLPGHANPPHNKAAFERWCGGRTGEPLVDAGMKELAATGYLSNRMRQIVASYLIHELACDWRAGAAWFESQLIDFDVCSNQGNWLYIAGRGTDPRGGRHFSLQRQAQAHDPDGAYQARWTVP